MYFKDILNEFKEHPRDVQTVPISKNRLPKWFYVYVKDGKLFVSNARNNCNSSKLTIDREISSKNFELMLSIYHRRCNGEAVSKEAQAATWAQVYWYGIFNELNL